MACQNCGECCGYVALEIQPESVAWLELHSIPLTVENGVRKLLVLSPCKWHDEEGKRCTHYEERPEICRTYLCSKARRA